VRKEVMRISERGKKLLIISLLNSEEETNEKEV